MNIKISATQANMGTARGLLYSYWRIPSIFIASILITLIFWAVLPANFQANESSDYIGFYRPVAQNILAGRGIVQADGSPAIAYPPGHSLVIATLLGLSQLLSIPEGPMLSAFALVAMATSSVFVYLLGRLIWGTMSGLIASLLWMTYPYALWLSKQPNSELSFLIVFYGGICLFWFALTRKTRAWYLYFLAGVLIGLAMLVRPIAFGVVFLAGITLWIACNRLNPRSRLFLLTALLLGSLVVVLPWEVWVYSSSGKVILLSTNGASSVRDGLTFAVNPKGYRQQIGVPEDVLGLMREFADPSGELKPLPDILSILTEESTAHPAVVVKLFAVKAARSWYATDSGRLELPMLFIQAIYLVLALLGSLLTWKQAGISRYWVMCVWLIVLFFWGMTVLVLSILRYMVPTMGLLFTLIPGSIFRDRAGPK